jgi:class 3 adenylate cyclase
MIIFQEDDPARHARNAVKTATSIQLETRAIHENLENKEEGLRINIGINSGSALVGFTQYKAVSGNRVTFTASGRTTIVASRLEDLATNGSILVSGETLRRIHDQPGFTSMGWEAESLGLKNLKNLSEPQPVFRIQTPSAT